MTLVSVVGLFVCVSAFWHFASNFSVCRAFRRYFLRWWRWYSYANKCVFGCVFCLSFLFFSFRLLLKTRACLVKCLYFCVACFCLLMSHLPFSIFHIPSSIFHLSSQNASILNSSFFIHSYNVNLFLYSQPHFGLFCFCCFFFVFSLSLWFVHCCSILHLQCGSLYIYFLFLFLISFLLFIIIISGWFKGPNHKFARIFIFSLSWLCMHKT